MKKAHLENGRDEQIVTHLERDLGLYVSDSPGEPQVDTVSQYATKNARKSKPLCHQCNKTGFSENPKPSADETERTSCRHEKQFGKQQLCNHKL